MSIEKNLIPHRKNGSFCKQQVGTLKIVLSKYKKLFFILGAILLVLIVSMLVLPSKAPSDHAGQLSSIPSDWPVVSSSKTQTKQTKTQAGDYITQRLQDISDQLATIRNRLDGGGTASLTSINQQLTGLIKQTKDLSAESNKMIALQIQESTMQLKKQLVLINTELVKLQKEQEHIKYLKPSDLPFKIASIDNIQQNNVVTINYNKTVFPIEIDSYIAGWKLISADFVAQKAEFVNAKKQHVIVDLNRMQDSKGDN